MLISPPPPSPSSSFPSEFPILEENLEAFITNTTKQIQFKCVSLFSRHTKKGEGEKKNFYKLSFEKKRKKVSLFPPRPSLSVLWKPLEKFQSSCFFSMFSLISLSFFLSLFLSIFFFSLSFFVQIKSLSPFMQIQSVRSVSIYSLLCFLPLLLSRAISWLCFSIL